MVKKLSIKEDFNPRSLQKYGFIRRPEDDFSDDGNRFRGYVYKTDKGEMPVTYLKSNGQVYLSAALHHKDELSYNEYKNLPSYRDEDKYNGVPEDEVDLADFAEICKRLISEYAEAVVAVEAVPLDKIEELCSKLTKAALDDYNKTLKLFRTVDPIKLLSVSSYKLKSIKDYFDYAKSDTVNKFEHYKDASERQKREFVSRTDREIAKYKNGESYWTKSIREFVEELK
jgi:hypothetical protein